MNRAATELYPGLQGLMLGMQPFETGQERRMNIENTIFEAINKPRCEDSHKSRQHNVGAFRLIKEISRRLFKGCTVVFIVGEGDRFDAVLPGNVQSRRIVAVTDQQ